MIQVLVFEEVPVATNQVPVVTIIESVCTVPLGHGEVPRGLWYKFHVEFLMFFSREGKGVRLLLVVESVVRSCRLSV